MNLAATPTASPADWQNLTQQPDLLGESPFWHPGEQMLYWVDIAARQLRRASPDGKSQVESWAMPSEPGCIAPARSGGRGAPRAGAQSRPP